MSSSDLHFSSRNCNHHLYTVNRYAICDIYNHVNNNQHVSADADNW